MKRKIPLKRMLSLLMSIIMTMTVAAFAPMTSSAKDTGTYGVLSYEIENGAVTITDCEETASGKVEIPGTIDGYPVTGIGDSAFHSCGKLTSIEIPDGVTSIGDYAFYCCSNLTSAVLPDGVTSIGGYAFHYCSSLMSIEISNSVTSIGFGAFNHCNSLASVEIPDSVTNIEALAFSVVAV